MEDGHTSSRKSLYLGCLTKQQLLILCVTVGLVILSIAIIVPAILLSRKTDPGIPDLSFATGGDMLDFLVQSGDISERDGLLATWFHRANGKEEMNRALASDAMILEADVTLQGHGTPNQKPIPIMAHPPNVTSDNTLDQWLDAVLESKKGIKLDFKSLASVGLSLDLLLQKNSTRGIHRPVWLNADILKDPWVPGFIPTVNGTQFLELVQEKFPDVTLSLGWMVLGVYTRAMVEEMFEMAKDLPQKVTFPIQALFVQKGWPHISWLLSQSSRFSLTLWQGSQHPTVEDLLFVRDNSHPARVYYDIYEPTLSTFKQAVEDQARVVRFYPGGDLMDFLFGADTEKSERGRSLSVRLLTLTDQAALSAAVKGL
ncbi:protein FAM151A [Eucyclogobius newberryi]|uniref:protein FAM151A n=1 Tax=Eucyclogobius newberryi TaxID=166745 RepID=UPI003B5B18DA